jgi:curli production assembly/transport component CsgF
MFSGAVLATAPVSAQDLVYTPVNPSFGGNPFNSGHLLGIANLQNDFEAPSPGGAGRRPEPDDNAAEIFARQLQSRLLAEVSNDVVEAIFGENPQDQGEVVFGDTVIRFNRGLAEVNLTIEDRATGSVTDISVPLLQ